MNLRQDARKATLKKWKATPPAVIAKPLKRLHTEHPDRKHPVTRARIGYAPSFLPALHAAQRGDGLTVKRLAAALA